MAEAKHLWEYKGRGEYIRDRNVKNQHGYEQDKKFKSWQAFIDAKPPERNYYHLNDSKDRWYDDWYDWTINDPLIWWYCQPLNHVPYDEEPIFNEELDEYDETFQEHIKIHLAFMNKEREIAVFIIDILESDEDAVKEFIKEHQDQVRL